MGYSFFFFSPSSPLYTMGCRCCKAKVPPQPANMVLGNMSVEDIMSTFDANGDGVLDEQELHEMMNKVVIREDPR